MAATSGAATIHAHSVSELRPEAPANVSHPLETLPGQASKREVYKGYVRAQRSAHNNLAPIHRFLPTEILMEVFAHIIPTSCTALCLLSVCRKWRYIALRTPEFWSDLLRIPVVTRAAVRGDPAGVERFRTFLQRSAPIKFSFNVLCLPSHVSEVLGAHLNQIGGLKVRVSGDEAVVLYGWLATGMPLLQELEIFHKAAYPLNPSYRDALRALQCTDFDLPRLQTLRVSPAFFVPGLAVPSLQTLHVGGCCCDDCRGDGKTYTLHDLSSFLRRCPYLFSVKFSMGSEPLSEPGELSHRPVSLPQLKTLTFEHYQAYSLRDVLSSLIIPHTTIVRINSETFAQGGETYFPPALRKLPLPWALRSLRVVVGTCTCDLLGANLRNESGRVKVGWKTIGVLNRRTEIFRDFADLFASPAVSRLHISVASNLYPTCLDGPRMAALLSAFPQLTFLRVGRKCHDLFTYLLAQSDPPPCQRLDHVIALWSVAWEDEFWESCDLVEKTLAHRAGLGLRLSILDLRFRRLYGLKEQEIDVDLQVVRKGLEERFRPLAEKVEITIEV
ncbi:hypothetical protein BD310DRAFT_373412 [Dichomitus squalens]|uniref:F-box domain-containing protein n=1 Tax=Dichomitus squalens TaxID=114155 RepID=A0A4Q9PZ05_9APHY|nr:hypothetical protein BD310DRAFT_373412 [Dichomitus squalens]